MDYSDDEMKEVILKPLEERSYFISPEDFLFNEWQRSFNNVLKERKLLDEKLYLNRKHRSITHKIEVKFENIQIFQKAWLNSTLEKSRPNVSIDQAVIDSDDTRGAKCMVLHPAEVKAVAANTFAKQFRKRDTHLDQLSLFWRNIYAV